MQTEYWIDNKSVKREVGIAFVKKHLPELAKQLKGIPIKKIYLSTKK